MVLGSAALAAPPRDIGQLLDAARTTLSVDANGLNGPGAAVMLPALTASRYVFIGEDHLTREIPQFATAVCDAMARQGGLSALAVEAGPEAARYVAAALKQPATEQRIADLQRQYPASIAFLDVRQEVEAVRHCSQSAGAGFSLWGLDQEFVGSAGWLLDSVAAEHPAAPAANLVARVRAEEAADAAQTIASGNMEQLYMFAGDRAAFARTEVAVDAGSTQRARALMQSLSDTARIYTEGGATSNRDRALLMKRTFADRLREITPANGRVLLKFGDYHGYQGINPLGQRDLGSFVAELADGQGARSLHIDVLGARGTHRHFAGYGRPTTLDPFVLVDDPDYRWLKPVMDRQLPGGWTLFDLRTLRHHDLPGIDPELIREIYGYDLLVIVPVLTPADLVR